MSYLKDKHECSICRDLYDLDQLNLDNVCRDCLDYDPRDHEDYLPEDDGDY